VKFNAIIQDQNERFLETLPLRWDNRTPKTPADDDEITTYFTGKVFAADIVADDQEAVVYEAGQLEYVTNVIPNLKLGKRFSQTMIARLNRIRNNLRGGNVRGDLDMFQNWEARAGRDLLRGIREQRNALICAMQLDSVVYDRLGIKITGSWGMPADLKFTPATPWTNPAALAVTDTLSAKSYAANTYGEVYDRMTLSTADFINFVSTTEFKQLVPGLIGQPLAATAFNPRDQRMANYASQLLGMDIELDDKLLFNQASGGNVANARVLPAGRVILSVKADDNDDTAMDFGNAIVTESQVAGLVGDPDNVAGGEQYGPFGYFTGNADLNPPNLIAWGVARGFPRKLRKTCTAVMTVA
jgi:hypothetical protein